MLNTVKLWNSTFYLDSLDPKLNLHNYPLLTDHSSSLHSFQRTGSKKKRNYENLLNTTLIMLMTFDYCCHNTDFEPREKESYKQLAIKTWHQIVHLTTWSKESFGIFSSECIKYQNNICLLINSLILHITLREEQDINKWFTDKQAVGLSSV